MELIKSRGRLWAAAAIIAPLGAPLPLSLSGAQPPRIRDILEQIFREYHQLLKSRSLFDFAIRQCQTDTVSVTHANFL